MNTNLDKIALDLYGKIQTRFPNIKIGDAEANVLSKKQDIPKARFFEFEYKDNGVSLGTITIDLDEDDGIVMQISGDLANSKHYGAFKFIRSFRQFAKNRMLKFDVQNIGKDNLDKRDYAFKAKPKEAPEMEPMMESKLYGTNKISYQDLGEAKLIIKHSQPVNPALAAGRTMHIESIYVENADGERFKYPFKHLNGARALAEHVKHGGNPYDAIGKHVIGLSEELASLRKFKGYVSRQAQLSEAMETVTGRVLERIEEIKETISKLQRPAYYTQFAESFEAAEEVIIPEEVQDDLINRLTIRTFNEDLKAVFPYIYKFVNETELPVVELSADDLLNETTPGYEGIPPDAPCSSCGTPYAKHFRFDADGNIQSTTIRGLCGRPANFKQANEGTDNEDEDGSYERGYNESYEDQFESFLNTIVSEDEDSQEGDNTLFSPNKATQQSAIDKFNEIMQTELKGGPAGINVVDSLKGIIDDPEFIEKMKEIDPDLDARGVIQVELTQMAKDNADLARILPQLDFKGEGGDAQVGGEEVPPAAPEAPPAAPPAAAEAPPAAAPAAAPGAVPAPEAPPAPVAESFGRSMPKAGILKAIHRARELGADLDTTIDFGHKEMTLHDCIIECGLDPKDLGFDVADQDSGVKQMLKSVAGFWNAEERNFTIGGTRAKTKIIKDFKNGEFKNANEHDLHQVVQLIDKLDPSGNEHNQIIRLAGVKSIDEDQTSDQFAKIMQQFQQGNPNVDVDKMFAQWKQQNPNAKVTQTHTSSGSIDGKPASYDDAIAKGKSMNLKLPKFGDDDTETDFDFTNPQNAMKSIQGKMGGMMGKMQGQVPNQNIQFPGGQMNPTDMMKQIMGKINFDKQ